MRAERGSPARCSVLAAGGRVGGETAHRSLVTVVVRTDRGEVLSVHEQAVVPGGEVALPPTDSELPVP